MSSRRISSCLMVVAWAISPGIHGVPRAGEIKPATDAPQPLPPEESLQRFRVAPGFRVELVAAEPHVADPVAIAFDANGKLYACELHGYNLEGHFDIVELNKTGKLDKQVRRIHATESAWKKAEALFSGTVKMLTDRDGDGQMDHSTVFADNLPPCYGLAPANQGIIVLCPPDIYYLADRDGDGRAEVREKRFTGLNLGELWSRSNHLVWGEDNWIYACAGRGHGVTIQGPKLGKPVPLGASGYRFKPDGSAIEPVTGSAGGFGLGISDWGDQFLVNNSTNGLQVVPIPDHYQRRNPHAASPGNTHSSATYHAVFPISRPHPWRIERGSQQAWRDFYGHGEANPNGSFTAACSPTIYRGAAFPPEYQGNLFACESQQNLVNRAVPERKGSKIFLQRPAGFSDREFLASSDGWFRPVNLATGPDGGLYVVDMYREIIEDYSAIPRYLQQQYGLMKGTERGRIWRVVHQDAPPSKRLDLATLPDAELAVHLSHRNAVWRTTAQRLLVERDAVQVVPQLEDIVRSDGSPQSKVHAIYTLDGLGKLAAEVIKVALADEHFAVRLHALRLAERQLVTNERLLIQVAAMANDRAAPVRLQLALTLGESADRRAIDALVDLATRHVADDWMMAAIMTSIRESAGTLLAELARSTNRHQEPSPLVLPICKMIGARRHLPEINRLIVAVANIDDHHVQCECLDGLLQGLGPGNVLSGGAAVEQSALSELLSSRSSQVNLQAFKLAGILQVENLPATQRMFAGASSRALNGKLTEGERRAAIDLLASTSYDRLKPIAAALLQPRQPIEVQLAAVRAVALSGEGDAGRLLLANWKGASPRVRQDILAAILSHKNRLPALLDALERGDVAPRSIESLSRLRLLDSGDDSIRRRAAAVFRDHGTTSVRAATLANYRAALARSRDADEGRDVFVKHCANCHQAGETGFSVGPPLTSAVYRSDEALLGEILDPSARITQGYRTYTVTSVDGRIWTGVLRSESANSIALRKERGVEEVVLRKDVDLLVEGTKSLMPEGLEQEINPAQMANLLAYLRQEFGPQIPAGFTLFEDEPEFVATLKHGRGKAILEKGDRASGNAALRISALQRYCPRIEGWQFPIVEAPGPGEYRYLRMAWKVESGGGIGVELAGDGDWGPAASEQRRYYSGKNTAPWRARQLAVDAPRSWTVVTIDLWRDNGEFSLTGIAPTAMGGEALFDRIELLRSLDEIEAGRP